MSNLHLLSESQIEHLKLFLPQSHSWHRIDDRRVLSLLCPPTFIQLKPESTAEFGAVAPREQWASGGTFPFRGPVPQAWQHPDAPSQAQ